MLKCFFWLARKQSASEELFTLANQTVCAKNVTDSLGDSDMKQ